MTLNQILQNSQVARSLALVLLTALLCGGISLTRVGAQSVPSAQNQSRPRRASETAPQSDSTSQPASKGETIGQDDVLKVDTDLTNILFTAVDKNKHFITTLRQEDIRVFEDGTPQEVFTFQQETDRPLSLALLIDVSVSQRETLPNEKASAQIFLDTIFSSQRDQVAIVSFTGDATVEQELTADVGRVRRAIDRVEIVLPPGYAGGGAIPGISTSGTPPVDPRMGTTAIWDAVWVTADELLSTTSETKRRAIILLTDGVDTSSIKERSEAIDHAVKNDTVIYSIGIGDSLNYQGIEKDTLHKLSERTGGRAFFPEDERELRAAFAQIQQELRSQYSVAYSSSNKRRDGAYRKVRIEIVNPELRKQKLRLTYRQGYFAKSAAPASVAPQRKP
ncbi:MAG: VWA domain-containing protein [Pyrinomonadaceae bacterium]